MTTLLDAKFNLDRQLLARQAAGLSAAVEQVDCVLCEDNASVMAYIYLAGSADVLTVVFDAPSQFDRYACADQLLGPDQETVH
jgi:hypothetical protein